MALCQNAFLPVPVEFLSLEEIFSQVILLCPSGTYGQT